MGNPRTHQDPAFIRSTFASIATRYDLANHALSGGADFVWREIAAREVSRWRPVRILDLATGSGDLAAVLSKKCPNALVVAADFCEPMLRQAAAKGVRNLVVADGTNLPFADATFDAVTVAFGLRNMADYDLALSEMARVLRPGGHALILDFSLPANSVLRSLYRAYLHHVLPQFASALTGDRGAYEYLGKSIEAFPRGKQMEDRMIQAGFIRPRSRPLWTGIVSIYTATRRLRW